MTKNIKEIISGYKSNLQHATVTREQTMTYTMTAKVGSEKSTLFFNFNSQMLTVKSGKLTYAVMLPADTFSKVDLTDGDALNAVLDNLTFLLDSSYDYDMHIFDYHKCLSDVSSIVTDKEDTLKGKLLSTLSSKELSSKKEYLNTLVTFAEKNHYTYGYKFVDCGLSYSDDVIIWSQALVMLQSFLRERGLLDGLANLG